MPDLYTWMEYKVLNHCLCAEGPSNFEKIVESLCVDETQQERAEVKRVARFAVSELAKQGCLDLVKGCYIINDIGLAALNMSRRLVPVELQNPS